MSADIIKLPTARSPDECSPSVMRILISRARVDRLRCLETDVRANVGS
jgi:hypothetical protein